MSTTHTVSTTPGQLRRRLASALLALSLAVGALALTATPAQATTLVSTCYTAAYGNFLVRGLPVKLQAWTGSGHVDIAWATLDSSGCASWLVPAAYRGHYLRTNIEFHNYLFNYYGGSYYYADPRESIAILWGSVTCYGCNL